MSLAIGIDKIEYGDVGDGIPGASLAEITDPIAEGSVAFSFSEPTETNIMSETSDVPVVTILTKEDPEYIEFALITPAAATLAALAGGTATTDKWEAPTSVPEINQTVKITTKTKDAEAIEYTIVNAKIVSRFNQAPAKKAEERLLVRCYIQEARTDLGVVETPFIREIVAVV
ncbi:MAG: hypothetical protein PF690_17505 [Deltaproteobacteria bacterium]|jgi:hypothetical protein|nr:hypothetical protein [Deltaproteobacteria bacterium]